MLFRWFMGFINHLPGWLIDVINHADHIVQRALGFPLHGDTGPNPRFPGSKARVIYPLILTRKHREWTKRQEQARKG